MSSAYGQIQKPESSEEIPSLNFTLKDGMNVVVQKYTQHTDKVTRELRQMLNDEIKAGCTYPQEQVLSGDEFCQYFLSSDAFIVTPAVDSPQVDVILGTFYIKPKLYFNFNLFLKVKFPGKMLTCLQRWICHACISSKQGSRESNGRSIQETCPNARVQG